MQLNHTICKVFTFDISAGVFPKNDNESYLFTKSLEISSKLNFNFRANQLEYDSLRSDELNEKLRIKMPSERYHLFLVLLEALLSEKKELLFICNKKLFVLFRDLISGIHRWNSTREVLNL